MAAVAQIHRQHPVPRLEKRKIDRHVRRAAAVRLHVRVLGAEKSFGPVNRQLLGGIDVLTTAIPAFARIALGVFVRQDRPLRFHHRRAGKIFAGDQLDVFLLTLALEANHVGDLPVNQLQSQCAGGLEAFHLADTPRVTASFEMRVEEGIDDVLGLFRSDEFPAQTQHVGVVVLPGQRRHFFVEHQRGAHAGNFIRRDAHADPGGAHEQAEVALLFGHRARHRLGEIRIIGRDRGIGAEIHHFQAAFFEVLPERLLQFVAGVVRAQRNLDGSFPGRAGDRAAESLVDELQHGGKSLFDLVAALQINFE